MAQLRNRTTGLVRDSRTVEREIRSRVSCGKTINFADFGEDVVFAAPAPAYDPITHSVREIAPVQTALGHWEQRWEVVALDAETVAANQARAAEQLQSVIVTSTQQRLDDFAKTRGYDGILSAATYASSTVPKFAQEGKDAVNLRDSTWAALYAILDEVTAGTRQMPSGFADIEPSLPVLAWSV